METSISKKLVNAIYSSLKSHEDTCERIQALVLWYRPVYSFISLLIIEAIFCIVYFLPFSVACNACIIIGTIIVAKCIYSAYPKVFDSLISFEYKKLPPIHQKRIRSVKEIAAYLATCLSIGTKLLENAFNAVETSNMFDIALILFALFIFFVFTFFIGDFCFIWLLFHVIFILPGFVLYDPVYNWINDPEHKHLNEGTLPLKFSDSKNFEMSDMKEEQQEDEQSEQKQKSE